MRLKYSFLFIMFVGLGFITRAQDTISYNVYLQRTSERRATLGKHFPKDTTYSTKKRTVDTLVTESIQSVPNLENTEGHGLKSNNGLAQRLDQAWRKELARMDLYDSISSMVHYPNYNKEVFLELTTDTLKSRLERLNAKTPFNVSYNPSLESVIKRYLKRHKPTMEKLMGVSEFYFPLFEENLDKHNIPLELKYLAIVESALRPKAKSKAGATGLWQFMFTTAKMYGLDVSSYVDERMDPIKSTEAASEYLSKLYSMFGDWDLALASYNSGPGNVSKAIRRSGGYTNYWNIREYLPRETAGYIPAFLATMYLFEYAKEHGYQPQKPPVSYFASDTIQVKSTITLEQVSRFTGESLETLQFLNPSYKLDIIPVVKSKNYYLRLPLESMGKFVRQEDAIYAFAKAELGKREKPLPKLTTSDTQVRYRVKNGDYLGKIANKYGVKVSQIKQWNNMRSNNLKIGQRLTIYPRNPVQTQALEKKQKTIPAGSITYTVKEGDSLWKIANKYPGVSVDNIRLWNGIRGNNLKPGITLVIGK